MHRISRESSQLSLGSARPRSSNAGKLPLFLTSSLAARPDIRSFKPVPVLRYIFLEYYDDPVIRDPSERMTMRLNGGARGALRVKAHCAPGHGRSLFKTVHWRRSLLTESYARGPSWVCRFFGVGAHYQHVELMFVDIAALARVDDWRSLCENCGTTRG